MYIFIRKLLLIGIILLTLGAAALAENILTVVKCEGTVQIFDSEKNMWQDIKAPYKLKLYDVLRTLSSSTCEIEFGPSRLKLKESSSVTVKALIEKINLKLHYGGILTKIKALPAGSSFEIETPQAIAGTRGTRYRVTAVKERSATRVSVLQKSVILKSVKEPHKYISIGEYEHREICPWEKAFITARGTGILSKEILGPLASEGATSGSIYRISDEVYGKTFGALARVTTKRAAVTDAHRKLAEKIYGVVIDSETTLEDHAVKNDVIRTTVKGVVRGAKEVSTIYYSDGSIQVIMETEATKVRKSLIHITGDIYGIDCILGPDVLETSDFEEFLL
ncbi:MAG: FecR domain-containing protein [Candidatus Omnitrophota bacterium]